MAESSEYQVGYTIYFDDVQFEQLGTIINPRPAIPSQTVYTEIGGKLTVGGTQVTFDVDGNVDNVYFYSVAATEPSAPAPKPIHDIEDVVIQRDTVKKYTNLAFAGIEFTSETIDASDMTHFRFDFWTPDPTADPAAFRVKLVDFGADGAFGEGDDSEHELTLKADSDPPLATGKWVSYDIPLSEFSGLAEQEHLAQLIISGDPNTGVPGQHLPAQVARSPAPAGEAAGSRER